MNSQMKKIIYFSLGGITLCIIGLCIYNGITNQDFWKISIFNGITMLWTIGLSFIITQQFGRYNKQIDIVQKVLNQLLDLIDESDLCRIHPNADPENLLMRNRQIQNQLGILDSCANRFGFVKDIKFLQEQFSEYEKVVSEHIHDIDYLSKSETTLSRPIKNMGNRIYALMLKL